MPFTSFNACVVPVLLGLLAYRGLTQIDIPNVWALGIVGLAACCLWTFYRLYLYPRHLTPFRHLPTPEVRETKFIILHYSDTNVSTSGVEVELHLWKLLRPQRARVRSRRTTRAAFHERGSSPRLCSAQY